MMGSIYGCEPAKRHAIMRQAGDLLYGQWRIPQMRLDFIHGIKDTKGNLYMLKGRNNSLGKNRYVMNWTIEQLGVDQKAIPAVSVVIETEAFNMHQDVVDILVDSLVKEFSYKNSDKKKEA